MIPKVKQTTFLFKNGSVCGICFAASRFSHENHFSLLILSIASSKTVWSLCGCYFDGRRWTQHCCERRSTKPEKGRRDNQRHPKQRSRQVSEARRDITTTMFTLLVSGSLESHKCWTFLAQVLGVGFIASLVVVKKGHMKICTREEPTRSKINTYLASLY